MNKEEKILLESLPPNNPNLPPGTTHVPIHPVSLIAGGVVDHVLVLPGKIDFEKLCHALQVITTLWPNIAGRFVTIESRKYAIKLTQSPIPVSHCTLSRDQVFPNRDVIQQTTAPFIDPLPEKFPFPDSDSSLFTIKVTTILPSNQTVVGIHWSHVLGDGADENAFLLKLSDLYCSPTTNQPKRIPSFFPHIDLPKYPPSQGAIEKWTRYFNDPIPFQDAMPKYMQAQKENEAVLVTISLDQLANLQKSVKGNEHDQEQDINLTKQDCLSAWWVSLLERTGYPSEVLNYTVNYRHLASTHSYFPENLSTISANVAAFIHIPIGPSGEVNNDHDLLSRIRYIARSIRRTLNNVRDKADETAEWLSVLGWQLEEGVANNKAPLLIPPPGECMINSNIRYDWNAHFGFPEDQTAYHTSINLPRFARIFQANPREGQGGLEKNIEISWSVKLDMNKETITRLIEQDRKRWM